MLQAQPPAAPPGAPHQPGAFTPRPPESHQVHPVHPASRLQPPPSPPTFPWGCSCLSPFLGTAPRDCRAPPTPAPHGLEHSLVAQDDPLDAGPEEDNGADIFRVVKKSRESTESCPPAHPPTHPCQWEPGPPCQPGQAPTRVSPTPRASPSPAPQARLRQALKDTDSRGGGDGQDGARGDGLLGIPQVSRAVGASHDAWGKRGQCHGGQSRRPGAARAPGAAGHGLGGVSRQDLGKQRSRAGTATLEQPSLLPRDAA